MLVTLILSSFNYVSYILSDKTIGFSAYITSPLANHNQKTVIYNTAETNKGSGYSTATGIFTVPVAGTYVFIWHAMTHPIVVVIIVSYISTETVHGLTLWHIQIRMGGLLVLTAPVTRPC